MMATNDHTPTARPTPKPSSSDNAARPQIRLRPDAPALIDALRPRSRRVKIAAGLAALGAIALPHAASAQLERPGRTAPAGCMAVEVQRGDTVSRIARANNLTLDQIANLNPHIANLHRVWPGDQIAVTCDPQGVALAVPQSVERGVDVSRWRDTSEPCAVNGRDVTCWTREAILVALHDGGFRGEDLVTLAAIVPGESGRQVDAVGDVDIQDDVYGPSVGAWQIRTVKAARGTGGPLDADRLNTLDGQVAAVRYLYDTRQAWRAKGITIRPAVGVRDGKLVYGERRQVEAFDAWTVYQLGGHIGHLDGFRALARDLGVL